MGEAATSHQPSTQAPHTSRNTFPFMASQGQKPSGKGPSFPVCELGLSTSTHYLENRIKPQAKTTFR